MKLERSNLKNVRERYRFQVTSKLVSFGVSFGYVYF